MIEKVTNKLYFPKDAIPDVEDNETTGFYEGTRLGQIRFPQCKDCNQFHWYPSTLCPFCHSPNIVWTPAKSQPRLFTWTQVRWDLAPAYLADFYPKRGPYIVGLVEYAEIPNGRLPTNLIDCQPEDLRIGMPLEVVFQQINEKVFIPLFRPKKNKKSKT